MLTHWKWPWCCERLKARREEGDRDEMVGWRHWLNGHEKPCVLQFMGIIKSWTWHSYWTTNIIINIIRLKAGGEGDDRGSEDWMTSLTWWIWVWASSDNWWWTGKLGVLQSMVLQRVRHDWVTELINDIICIILYHQYNIICINISYFTIDMSFKIFVYIFIFKYLKLGLFGFRCLQKTWSNWRYLATSWNRMPSWCPLNMTAKSHKLLQTPELYLFRSVRQKYFCECMSRNST